MSIINHLSISSTFYQQLFPLDCAVVICDVEGYIIHTAQPRDFSIPLKIGGRIRKGGALQESLITKKISTKFLPRELYGIAVKSISQPLFQDGNLIGAMALIINNDGHEKLIEFSQVNTNVLIKPLRIYDHLRRKRK